MAWNKAIVGIQLTLVAVLIAVLFGDLTEFAFLSMILGLIGTVLVYLSPTLSIEQ